MTLTSCARAKREHSGHFFRRSNSTAQRTNLFSAIVLFAFWRGIRGRCDCVLVARRIFGSHAESGTWELRGRRWPAI